MDKTLKLMTGRQSSRVLFEPDRKVETQVLEQILEAGSWAPTAHNMQNFEIVVVDDREMLNRMSMIRNPTSPVFIRENYEQLSFSEEELKKKKTGILADGFPSAWRTPEARLGNVPDTGSTPQLGRLVQAAPVMLIVLYDPAIRAPASEGDFLGIISLGCVMENMWLMAHALGVGFHIMSVLGNEPVEREVKELLNIPDNLRLAFSCRLGYPEAAPGEYLRVRREVADFTHRNRYGN
jgi:nitroreductase